MLSPLHRPIGQSRLAAADCVLLIVDVQTKLLAKIPAKDTLVRNVKFLTNTAALVHVPIIGTEQYPKGLGPTTDELRSCFTAVEKTAFSCAAADGFLNELQSLKRRTVVVVGMESHVCVLQTVLDLLDSGYAVHVPVDAVASRDVLDHTVALERMKLAGATLSTVETVGFEWLGDSRHPQFKAFSQLVIERTS